LLIVADFHSGHKSGLRKGGGKYWDYFIQEVKALGKIDICLANGDLIDGRGERSGGTELITTDRHEQSEMAQEILEEINATDYLFTYGTKYHTSSDGEDFEGEVAKHFKAPIGGQQFFDINGLVFHAKHKISGSSIPHGRFTALARQKVWNLFWSEYKQVPKANIFIRSHVHYYDFCGGYNWLAVITPALLGWGTKYGERECEGTIDFGIFHMDIEDQNNWTWKAHIAQAVESATVHKY